jgi:hypothetical protein
MLPLALGVYREPAVVGGLRLAPIPSTHRIFRMSYKHAYKAVDVLLGAGDLALATPELHCGEDSYNGFEHQVNRSSLVFADFVWRSLQHVLKIAITFSLCVQLWLDLSQLPQGEAARLLVVHGFFLVATVDMGQRGLLRAGHSGIPLRLPPLRYPCMARYGDMLWLPLVEAGGHGHDPAAAGTWGRGARLLMMA